MPAVPFIVPIVGAVAGGLVSKVMAGGAAKTAETNFSNVEGQAGKLNASADQFMSMMQDRWNFYKEHGEGVDIAFIDDAMRQYREGTGAAERRAVAETGTAYDRAGAIDRRNMARYGVDPTSGEAMALGRQTAVDRAESEAFSRDKARRDQQDLNLRTLGMASDIGQGAIRDAGNFGTMAANQRSSAANLYTQLGQQATQSASGISRVVNDVAGRMPWDSLLNNGGGTSGVIDSSQQQPGPYTDNYVMPGTGGLPDYTQYNPPVGQGYARGGVVRGAPTQPAPRRAMIPQTGRVVHGAAGRDRVQAVVDGRQPARLSAGEYVIPKDVLSFKGREFFDNVIRKSRGEGRVA